MKFDLTALALACCCVLAGCGKPEQPKTPQVSGASLMNSPKVSTVPAQAPVQPEAVLAKADATLPVSQYQDLNALPKGQALTYLVVAKTSPSAGDDQKLNTLSAAYYNEPDAFKKRDLAKTELPRINAQLSQYQHHDYYSLPLSAFADKPLGMTNVTVGPYDFNTESFPLTSYGQYCWANPVRNPQGVSLKVMPSDFPCSIKVADTDQARAIEEARAHGTLALTGTLYLHIPQASGGTAEGQVVHAKLQLSNNQTQKTVANIDL